MHTKKLKKSPISIIALITLSTALSGLAGCSSEPKPFDRESYDRQQKAAQQSDRVLDQEVQKLNP